MISIKNFAAKSANFLLNLVGLMDGTTYTFLVVVDDLEIPGKNSNTVLIYNLDRG